MSTDAIVIGAGINGLVTAGMLAKRGKRVVVVDQRDPGDNEFADGYQRPSLLLDTTGMRPWVIHALELERCGLRTHEVRPAVIALGEGKPLILSGDDARTAASIAEHSKSDAVAYRDYQARIGRLRRVLSAFLDEPPINAVDPASAGTWDLLRRGLRVRRLGRRDMMELLRVVPMCVADWLGEWFETDRLKAALALPAVAGQYAGPWSPGTNANLLLHSCGGTGVIGGGRALADALRRCVDELEVELHEGLKVEHIVMDGAVAAGVKLDNGETLVAPVIAASCHPRTVFLDLLTPGATAARVRERIANYRTRGTTARVHLALSAPLSFSDRDEPIAYARTGAHVDDIERAFDAVKYRQMSETPVLDIYVPSVEDPDVAPEGHSVVAIDVHFAARDLEGGWTDTAGERLGDRVVEVLAEHAPTIRDSIVAREVITPADLEATYGLCGGNIHHGEPGLDQLLVRPIPECVGYATPIDGLYLCGSGSHPGPQTPGSAGALAARRILQR